MEDIPNFKIHGHVSPAERKKIRDDIINEGFEDILTAYEQSLPESDILKYNNSIVGDGRHISTGIVNITDVVAVNLICDVIDGIYSASDNSTTAQQGFVLYAFSPKDPPGFLIVQEPIYPVLLRCHNPWLSRINFRLTNQLENLLDIRGETV